MNSSTKKTAYFLPSFGGVGGGSFFDFSAEKFGGIEILRIFAVFKVLFSVGRESSPDAPHSGFFYALGGTPIQAVRSPRDAVVMAVSSPTE